MAGKISDDADKVVAGTEKLAAALAGVNYGILISSVATYLQSLAQTLTNKTIVAANNTIRGVPVLLAQSGALVTHTGTVTSTTLATVNIPANTLGANDALRIAAHWSAGANNANGKTVSVRFGGTAFSQVSLASNLSARSECFIQNANSVTAQFGGPASNANISTADYVIGALNTATALDITLTCALANTGDTVYLRGYTVELMRA